MKDADYKGLKGRTKDQLVRLIAELTVKVVKLQNDSVDSVPMEDYRNLTDEINKALKDHLDVLRERDSARQAASDHKNTMVIEQREHKERRAELITLVEGYAIVTYPHLHLSHGHINDIHVTESEQRFLKMFYDKICY
jgi:hypothetical protein